MVVIRLQIWHELDPGAETARADIDECVPGLEPLPPEELELQASQLIPQTANDGSMLSFSNVLPHLGGIVVRAEGSGSIVRHFLLPTPMIDQVSDGIGILAP
jgi:hypothetical protein